MIGFWAWHKGLRRYVRVVSGKAGQLQIEWCAPVEVQPSLVDVFDGLSLDDVESVSEVRTHAALCTPCDLVPLLVVCDVKVWTNHEH